MAYIINRYDGSRLTVIDDGVLDSSIPVGLVGRNYTGWGEVFNENYVFLLENFRGSNPPPRALQGQAWYDANNKVLKSFDGTNWIPIGSAEVSEMPPTATQGGFWLKTTTEQLFVSVGGEWKLVGPEGIEGYNTTRVKSEVLLDSADNPYPVMISYVDGQPISIFSLSSFELKDGQLLGYTNVENGLTFRSDSVVAGNLKGNADTATVLKTSRSINGVFFDGSQNIIVKSSTTNPLLKGDYIVGSDWDGTLSDTWSVDATSENRIGKVVARDANGEFSAERISANLVGDVTGNVTALSGNSRFNTVEALRVTATDFVGNSSTATRLRIPRTINTVPFDGTANITLPVPSETLVGSVLAPNVVTSSLTTLGKLVSLNVNDVGIEVSNNSSKLKIIVDQTTPTIRSELSNRIKLELFTGSSTSTKADITFIPAAETASLGISGPALVPDFNKTINNTQRINLGTPTSSWNTVYSNNFKGTNLDINLINSPTNFVSFGGGVSVAGSVSGQFVGPLTGNVTGNLTGNVTGSSSLNALKSGDTFTGDINWNLTDRGINWSMNTDGASIKFYNTGDTDTNSRLEFNTRDNGNEYFRWTHTRSGGFGLFESMRLVPNTSGNSVLTVSGQINSSGSISASTFVGSGLTITALDASRLTTGRVPNDRLSGSYTISIDGNSRTVTSITGNQVTTALGYIPANIAGSTFTGDLRILKNNPWITLDSPSVGPSGTDQGAGISIGESGYKGSAAFHITYTGDGFSHIGMGVVDPTTNIMAFRAMRLYYLNNNVDFYGTINVPTVNASTLRGSGTSITNINASNLSIGTVPAARLSGSYNISIDGNANTVTSITGNQVTTALGYIPANIAGSTFTGNVIVGATNKTSDSIISVRAGDLNKAGFEAHGSSQGTGYFFVGQSTSFGGGISYNGYNNPAFVIGELPDRITFFRRASGISSAVFYYAYNSDNVIFRGGITATSIAGTGSGLTEINANNISTGRLSPSRLTGEYNISITGNASTATQATSATNVSGGSASVTTASVSGRLNVSAGINGGIKFPNDPGGGSGDTASITYEVIGIDRTRLRFRVSNDATGSIDDKAEFITPDINGVLINNHVVLNAANFNNYSPTRVGVGASGTWPININGNSATVSTLTSGQVVSALGYVPANGSGAGLINGEQNYQDNILRRPTIIDYSVYHNALGSRSGNVVIDCEQGNYVSLTAVGTINWSFTNPATGLRATGIIIELANGGSYIQNWPPTVRWPSGTAPVLSASGIDVLIFITDDAGANWRGAISMSDSR
jgi:hypothetical protein